MTGFGWVNEECGRTGAGEGGGKLATDVARLAHSGDDHPSAAREQEQDRFVEAVVEVRGDAFDGVGFSAQHLPGDL